MTIGEMVSLLSQHHGVAYLHAMQHTRQKFVLKACWHIWRSSNFNGKFASFPGVGAPRPEGGGGGRFKGLDCYLRLGNLIA